MKSDLQTRLYYDQENTVEVILVAVRSTGSRFFVDVFEQAGIKNHGKGGITGIGLLGEGLHTSHCEPIHMNRLEHRVRDCPLFLTMRHPRKVAQSWINRGWAIGSLFFAEWYNLFWLHEKYDGHWLPLDTPDRDERLHDASEIIGVKLTTDWEPLATTETSFKPRGMTVEQAMKALRVMPFPYYMKELL